ncbi:phage tail protein [Cronobacter sp. EKM101R]|uniref:phage tail protein n=1 Tax=unclassified Cronobacter TaxID=2649764 RepID=UPI0013EBE241|nr:MULTISPECIES: phage tail protein [unclassified Cronobacter]KAF6596215.1 phage tail protein [Cronobacter sp. EKM101R]KAF6599042.1 phage tail protein [Cronobacter sp. EKM102R]
MILGFGNNVISSLAADITAQQTTIQVMPGAGTQFAKLLTYDYANASNVQKVYSKITLTDAKETVFEICHLTAVSGDMLTVIRGQEGTTARGWSLNDVVANFATRGSENQFVQIEQLQSGHYTSCVVGGTANALTVELPATFFVNGATDWQLRAPLVLFPVANNTGPATIQLTLGGRVVGTFPLRKGNNGELSAGDIIQGCPLLCLLDNSKSCFYVFNPRDIYMGDKYLQKDMNGSDIPDKKIFIKNIGLDETVDKVTRAILNLGMIGDVNLNTLTGAKYGRYYQNYSAKATASNNYPVAAAGALDVIQNGAENEEGCTQEYFPYNSNVCYRRYYIPSRRTWSSWEYDLTSAGGVIKGAVEITGDARSVTIKPKTANGGYYFFGRKADNTNHFYLGQGSANSDNVTWGNYLTNSSISLVSGGVAVSGAITPSDYRNFDARYIQNLRVGAVGSFVVAKNTWREAPVGAFMTGWYTEGSEPGGDTVRYRPLQVYINGAWRTISS